MGLFKQKWKRSDGTSGVSKKWHGEYRDARGRVIRVPLSADKAAARMMLADLVRQVERARAGLVGEIEGKAASVPLKELLDAWIEVLKLRGRSERHLTDCRRLVGAVLHGCGWRFVVDLSAEDLDQYLGAMKGRSARTKASYRGAVVAFAKWLESTRRIGRNPLVDAVRPGGARVRIRRAFTLDELRRLLEAALVRPLEAELLIRYGPRTGQLERNISETTRRRAERLGRHNRLLYLVAFHTGLRAGELAKLRVADIVFGDELALVTLPRELTKGRRDASIPVRASVAGELAAWITQEGLGARDLVFNVSPFKTASELRKDLQRAGIPVTDARGRVADFHSLRVSLASHLNASGVAVAVAQDLLRHTDPRLTLGIYHDTALNPVREAVEGLPDLLETRKLGQNSDKMQT